MTIGFPQEVIRLIGKIEEAGFRAYGVGGAVRDALLGKEPQDWDLCTNALPADVECIFEGYPVILTGLRHGTVTVLWEGKPYEITTFRRDGAYSDGRHPDGVCFVSSLKEDLARRDFTINAMACRPGEEVTDPFGGMEDLGRGLVRAVGEAERRFEEDGLRLLRAARFAAACDFEVEEKTAQGMRRLAPLLKKVSAERIAVEWDKLIVGPGAGRVLGEFPQLWEAVLPLAAGEREGTQSWWRQWGERLDSLPKDPLIRTAALFGRREFSPEEAADRAARTGQSLRWDRKRQRQLVWLAETAASPLPQTTAQWLRLRQQAGEPDLLEGLRAIRLAECRNPNEQEEMGARWADYDRADRGCSCRDRGDLAVTGRDLEGSGIPRGPETGRTLDWLLEKVWAGELPNEAASLLAAARQRGEGGGR